MNGEQLKKSSGDGKPYTVGVISDTHGLLRPEAIKLLEGVDQILHAGDVGEVSLLSDLAMLAPITAVWGNMDGWDVRERTTEVVEGELEGLPFAMLHGHQIMPHYDRLADRFPHACLVVHGHSHMPAQTSADGVFILNPGSAGPRRRGTPVSVARVKVIGGRLAEILHLDVETGRAFRPEG